MKSMTGYGRGLLTDLSYELSVEIKSVNNRFLDLQFHLPKELSPYEGLLRKLTRDTIARGRVELYVNLISTKDSHKQVKIHWDLIEQLVRQVRSGTETPFQEVKVSTEDILLKVLDNSAYVALVDHPEMDENLEKLVHDAVSEALAQLVKSREQEGAGILQVIRQYHAETGESVAQLNSFVTEYEADYRKRYEEKLQEYLGASVDQPRLLTELAILLERGDIHEELDRLAIHLKKMDDLLQSTKPVGRELDFLLQEMNREVNTIGAKSSPIEIKNLVVRLKTVLEKIREQIQNVE